MSIDSLGLRPRIPGQKTRSRWARNVRLTVTKRCSATNAFLYREPLLDGVSGGDGDAVYDSCPLDTIRHLRRCGARLVETSAHRCFGWPGWLLPSELQGASVLAWVVD